VKNIENAFTVKVSKRGDTMFGPLGMGNNKITSTYVPSQDADLVNIKHLKTLYTAYTSGHVLDLAEDHASSGFIVSCSSSMPQRFAFHAFKMFLRVGNRNGVPPGRRIVGYK